MFRLNVLNPGGRDPEQHFADTLADAAAAHAPVNFHAYAAATGGSFFREVKHAVEAKAPVLLLLRGGFRESERALNFLHKAGLPVAVALKETGLHQIAQQLSDATKLARFCRLLAKADGCIAPTPEGADIYRTLRGGSGAVAFIPTPYPLHEERWNFFRPNEERSGVFLGTREFDIPSRNHLAALLAARQISEATNEHVTVYNFDGRKGDALLETLGFPAGRLRVLKRGGNYADYLRVVAGHKIVFQLDTSFVPGQVAGDALLGRLPCVGGNGAIERLAFPELCGAGKSLRELIEVAIRLLQDVAFYQTAVADSQKRAMEHLSFSRVAQQLQNFFDVGGEVASPQ